MYDLRWQVSSWDDSSLIVSATVVFLSRLLFIGTLQRRLSFACTLLLIILLFKPCLRHNVKIYKDVRMPSCKTGCLEIILHVIGFNRIGIILESLPETDIC
jgi:hypothetical protein